MNYRRVIYLFCSLSLLAIHCCGQTVQALPDQSPRATSSRINEKILSDIKKGENPFIALRITDDISSINIVIPANELKDYFLERNKMKRKKVNSVIHDLIAGAGTMEANDYNYDYLKGFQTDVVFYEKIEKMDLAVVRDNFFKESVIDTTLMPGLQNTLIFYMLAHDVEVVRKQPGAPASLVLLGN